MLTLPQSNGNAVLSTHDNSVMRKTVDCSQDLLNRSQHVCVESNRSAKSFKRLNSLEEPDDGKHKEWWRSVGTLNEFNPSLRKRLVPHASLGFRWFPSIARDIGVVQHCVLCWSPFRVWLGTGQLFPGCLTPEPLLGALQRSNMWHRTALLLLCATLAHIQGNDEGWLDTARGNVNPSIPSSYLAYITRSPCVCMCLFTALRMSGGDKAHTHTAKFIQSWNTPARKN